MPTDSGNPPLIALIEDNPGDVHLLRAALDQQGEPYRLELFMDGEAAIGFLVQYHDSAEPAPCVIVLDLHLPRFDGLEVLRAIRRTPRLAHCRVAVLTSSVRPSEEAEVRSIGVQLYHAKPSELDAFFALGVKIMELCKEGWSLAAA